jgi:hypothetical protein
MPHGQELSVPVCWRRELVPGLSVVSQRANKNSAGSVPFSLSQRVKLVARPWEFVPGCLCL